MNRSSTITTLRTYCQRLRAAAFALLCTALMTGGALAQTVTYFHNDIAGTPQLATNASGAVVWKENYLPYGQRQVAEPASAGNRLWYTGKPHDVDTGLTYMGARYYMPTLGRFTGIDPKAFSPEQPHSLNRYAYGNNNPYKYVDPDGRFPVLAVAVGGVVVMGAAGVAVMPAEQRDLMVRVGTRVVQSVRQWMFNEGSEGANSEEGCIYCVKGDKTSSGRDYVGSTDNLDNRQRDKSDGRNREGAEVVDTYPKGDRDARRTKEQQAINDRGGVDKLDNKRNEVAPKKWPDMGISPP